MVSQDFGIIGRRGFLAGAAATGVLTLPGFAGPDVMEGRLVGATVSTVQVRVATTPRLPALSVVATWNTPQKMS